MSPFPFERFVDPRVVLAIDELTEQNDEVPPAEWVVERLIDEDVARGWYEGCSDELEQAYVDYRAQYDAYVSPARTREAVTA